MAELTPMMKQYFAIKEKVRDYILFYRLGDFYEMFFEDAITASRELELTLTGRDCGQEERAPMCGVPYHASEVYIGRLVRKGYKVAICEQVEDPKSAKGIVKRDIVRMVTPGTVIEASIPPETPPVSATRIFRRAKPLSPRRPPRWNFSPNSAAFCRTRFFWEAMQYRMSCCTAF